MSQGSDGEWVIHRAPTTQAVSYRDVLRLPGGASLLVAGLVGQLPIGMVSLALLLSIDSMTASYSIAGLAIGAYLAAIGVAAPLWGRLVDRRGAWGVLVGSGLGFLASIMLLTLTLAGHMPLWFVLAAVVLVGATRPALLGAMQVLWTRLATDPVVRAKAFSMHAQELGFVWVVGPLAVSGVLAVAGPDLGPLFALMAAGVFGVGGALMVARIWRLHGGVVIERRLEPTSGGDGEHTSLYTRSYMIILASSALFEVAVGSSQVAIVASADLSGQASMSGLLVALWFIGCILGGLWPGVNRPDVPVVQRYRRSLLALALSYGIYAGLPNPWLLAGALLIGGMALAWTFSSQYSATAELTPPNARAEGFTWLSTMATGGAALGAALAGPLIEYVGHEYVAFLVSAVFALAAAAATTLTSAGNNDPVTARKER